MARTELPNGVILPAEYSDDWYEDMTSNLTKLDDVIGSDSEKLNADGVYFLRMSSAALTDSGTGNFSDLNSSYKIKTGDLVLDSGRKLYRIVSVDSTNETFTVGNSLFKVTAESDLAPVAESGDYGDLDNRPDLNPYDQHLANTDKHVTTADKTKWNNGVSQSYVLRYSSTAITDNSTIAYSTLDNTDNIKADDKIIDVDGKIFSIVSVDSDNSTVTVGSALIDLALDADVVHNSGNETVGGQKTFANNRIIVGRNTDTSSAIQLVNSDVVGGSANGASGLEVYGSSVSTDNKIGGVSVGEYSNNGGSYATIECNRTVSDVKTSNTVRNLIRNDGSKEFSAGIDNDCKLGHPYFRWSEVYATNYYYGANNVEFSTKFVTTDTNQTVGGIKTFINNIILQNSDTSGPSRDHLCKSQIAVLGDSVSGDSTKYRFVDKNNNEICYIRQRKLTNSNTDMSFCVNNIDNDNNSISAELNFIIDKNNDPRISPSVTDFISLGRPTFRWKNVFSNQINGLTPSSLSMPSDRSARIDISGYITNLGNGDNNSYTVPANGYIWLHFTSINSALCYSQTSGGLTNYAQTFAGYQGDGLLYAFFPVRNGDNFVVQIYTSSTAVVQNAYFIPCQGNV